MHMRPLTFLFTGLLAVAGMASVAAQAMDLKQVYEKALRNDPQYQAARQDIIALAEVYPQALAQLLPNVGLNASRNSVNLTKVDGEVSSQLDYLSLNNAIVVRQALYRKPQFAQLQQASVQQKSLVFIEEKAGADLVLRVTNAYFDALYAVDTFAQLQATWDAAQQQLRAARRIFESGQGTRTDVDEAQARADQARAQWLMAKQNLTYTQRQLAMLVGEKVTPSAALRADLPWSSDTGDSPDRVVQALTHNPEIQLAKVKLETAELEVRKNHAGHWPTLDLVAQRSISKSENTQFPFTDYYTNQVGVQLNIPLYAGGAVSSSVRQATANLAKEQQNLQMAQNDLTLKVEKELINLQDSQERIQALQVALASAAQLVVSYTKGILAGTRTQTDRLNAMQREAEARRDLLQARYQWVLSMVKLKLLCGESHAGVMEQVNASVLLNR